MVGSGAITGGKLQNVTIAQNANLTIPSNTYPPSSPTTAPSDLILPSIMPTAHSPPPSPVPSGTGAPVCGGTLSIPAGAQCYAIGNTQAVGTFQIVTLDQSSNWILKPLTASPLLVGTFTNHGTITVLGNATAIASIDVLNPGSATLNGGGTISPPTPHLQPRTHVHPPPRHPPHPLPAPQPLVFPLPPKIPIFDIKNANPY